MPEDVRRYFSLHSRMMQAQQRIDAETKAKDDHKAEMDKIALKVTQTGSPIVAMMPNGDTYVMFNDGNGPTVEKVNVVTL